MIFLKNAIKNFKLVSNYIEKKIHVSGAWDKMFKDWRICIFEKTSPMAWLVIELLFLKPV